MKKFKKLILDALQSFDCNKRPEEMKDWKELLDGIIFFLLFETAIFLIFIVAFSANFFTDDKRSFDASLFIFLIFTIANFAANILLTGIGAIMIFAKKRKSQLKNTGEEDPNYVSKRLHAWCFEHPPWI